MTVRSNEDECDPVPNRSLNMAKSKTTSTKAAKSASKVLKDDRTGKDSKTAAGSALSQKPEKSSAKGKSTKS